MFRFQIADIVNSYFIFCFSHGIDNKVLKVPISFGYFDVNMLSAARKRYLAIIIEWVKAPSTQIESVVYLLSFYSNVIIVKILTQFLQSFVSCGDGLQEVSAWLQV